MTTIITNSITAVIDYLSAEQTGVEAYETVALQVALNALGTTALREDYAPVVRRCWGTGFALSFGALRQACAFPPSYMPRRDREDAVYLLPWAV